MSTHSLDVSGARPLTTTLNDPAATRATCSAKAGDDVAVNLGGFRETRLVIPPGARIERRLYVTKKQVMKDGVYVKDDAGEYVYEEHPYEQLVLVVAGSGITVFGRASSEEEGAFQGTPHTTVSARRMPDPHFTESGELIDQEEVAALADLPEGVESSLVEGWTRKGDLFDAPPPGGDFFPSGA